MSAPPSLTHADFAATLGDTYALALQPQAAGELILPLVLAQADTAQAGTVGASEATAQPAGFSLLFRGPADGVLPQGTYPLTHPELGEQLIFLVPIGRDADGVSYEAVFACAEPSGAGGRTKRR